MKTESQLDDDHEPFFNSIGQTETTRESRGMSASPHWPSKAVQPLPAKLGCSRPMHEWPVLAP